MLELLEIAVGLQICLDIQFSLRSASDVHGVARKPTMFACLRDGNCDNSPMDKPSILPWTARVNISHARTGSCLGL